MQDNKASKRIGIELKNLQGKDKFAHTDVSQKESSDLRVWLAKMTGPKGSPFEGAKFQIEFDLRKDYPFKQPEVKFITPIHHPNVDQKTGELCQRFLGGENGTEWKPETKMKDVIEKIQNLLGKPEPEFSVDEAIMDQFANNNKDWFKDAKEKCKRYK
eukprot:TRINITY_DN17109_c0_g1_i1.p1 TRINITY_DN17109_c0_g1~~TRINITY_DN17109_c0_g1_i1.p1  ORF type:complete len:158 (+),score=44.99 TRINITY_DN17109_c0_g1_i1:41-514(+)